MLNNYLTIIYDYKSHNINSESSALKFRISYRTQLSQYNFLPPSTFQNTIRYLFLPTVPFLN